MFCEEQNTTKDDFIIILGDAGINYNADTSDFLLKQKLNKMPISFICIHGNHEMRPEHISTYRPSSEFFGYGWYEPRFPDLFFAKDGEVFTIAGKRCLVIGGAYSVDKYYRLMRGAKWFADEQPDDHIKKSVEDTIERLDHKIDIVFSHTCPLKYIPVEMFLPGIDQSKVDRSTEAWLDKIEDGLTYERWYCGHYHTDKVIDKMRFMFNDIICLEE